MCIEIKPLEEIYLEQVATIYNYYIENTTVTYHTLSVTAEEMGSILFNGGKGCITLGIFDNDYLCGYAYSGPYNNRQAFCISAEVTIYIHKAYMGKGICSLALKALEQYAKDDGIRTLLGVICGENLASINFFLKNGYEKCAHLKEVGTKFGRILDLVIYQKFLG